MALYSAEIVFRDGSRRSLVYCTILHGVMAACIPNDYVTEAAARDEPLVGVHGAPGIDYVTFGQPDGRLVTFNLNTVQTMETWRPVSPVAEDAR